MKKFYTHALQRGSYIYLRGIENGKRFKTKVRYRPYLFVPAKKGSTSPYKTLSGSTVDRIDFDDIYEGREFIKRYDGVSGLEIYGLDKFLYTFLNDEYSGELVYDKSLINICNIDIEVESDSGFPNIRDADKAVTAITMQVGSTIYVLGCGDYTPSQDAVTYIKCTNEANLLLKFLEVWQALDIDVITGWNVEFFDIPYLVNRITKVHDETFAKKLSPWNMLDEKKIEINGKEQQAYSPVGIAVLDYLQLYKKYTYTNQESYRLDHICSIEIGESKIDYSEFDNLFALYKEDYQKFIDYNINDVLLVQKLDDKMKLIDLAFTIAYDAKTNYEDVFTSVRLWDVIIHNYLINQKIVIPQFKHTQKYAAFAGAYVKDPLVGQHDWVVSLDVTSEYPSIIVQYNISPETYAGKVRHNYTVDQLLNGAFNDDEIQNQLKDSNFAITANGGLWDRSKKGALPALVEKMMDDRKIYKNKMLDAKRKYEKTPTQELSNEIARYTNLQMARKIQLNSLYGTLGNQYSRWFQIEFAEAITLTGQFAIRWIEKNLNEYMNKLLNTTKRDYVIAVDTDSNYLNMGPVVKKFLSGKTTEQTIDALDKICKDKLEPYIEKCFDDLAQHTNAHTSFLKMKRESIANKGIWTAKKRYILNVYDNEGVRYAEAKLKMNGIEAVKSSTPASCRAKIKDALKLIMETDEATLQRFVEKFRCEFVQMSFEQIAFPRGCRGLSEYRSRENIYQKGTPIHVRGALLYNSLLNKYNLTMKYPQIQEGEKIKFCYMKTPNPIKENVLAVATVLPKQFGLERYIDYETQFEKAFLDPMRIILNVINWSPEKISTLEGFFE